MIPKTSSPGNYIAINNSNYSYFAGNNYLGLAGHSDLTNAATDALKKYGVNFSASRKTTGTSEIHLELEKLLSEFKGQQDAVVFATGYMGNTMLLHALKGQYSKVYADSQSHPSILDGIPCGTPLRFYDHCNPNILEDLLRKNKTRRPLIITDGIFALTGEIAPLFQIYPLCEKYDALLIVDDAHATGVLGKNGRGTPEHFNLDGAANIYQSETMSKAMGAYGGFISSGKETIEEIRAKSSFYGASTALPPPIAAAGCASVKLIKQYPELRDRLRENSTLAREGIRKMGFDTIAGVTPIIPVFFQDKNKAKGMSKFLWENKIIAPSIDYPVKMDKFIVRITVSVNHTKEQIESLLSAIKNWRDNDGTNND